jgi:hypothetical protein
MVLALQKFKKEKHKTQSFVLYAHISSPIDAVAIV